MTRSLSLFIALLALWLLLSAQFDPMLLGLGLVSCLFSVIVAHRMDVIDRESYPLHMSVGLLRYWAGLLRDIVVANAVVVREILRPRVAITPTVVSFETRQRTDLGKVILGNSITLTPGTVTLDIDNRTIVVHALLRTLAEDAAGGSMDARVPPDAEAAP